MLIGMWVAVMVGLSVYVVMAAAIDTWEDVQWNRKHR